MNDSTMHAQKTGNVFLIGFMGSGKSHWGRLWAATTDRSFVDLDEMVETAAGKSVADIFEKDGEASFRGLETTALKSCIYFSNAIIACGGGAPCFNGNMQWMNEQGLTVYLTCTPAEILSRVILERDKRPLIKKLNQAELLFFIQQKLKEREPFYNQAKISMPSHLLTIDSFSHYITHHLL